MVMMSCDDMNKFLYVCADFVSRIHKFSICDVITSAEKWFLWLASQDLELFCFPGGTPGEREVVMAYPAALSACICWYLCIQDIQVLLM